MLIKVRRNPVVYLIHALAVVLAFWWGYLSIAERSLTFQIIAKFVFFPFEVTLFLRIIFLPYYIELSDGIITIHRDLFSKESFEAQQVKKIQIATNPLEKSNFVLENHSVYDFFYFYVDDSSFNSLIQYLNKPVEDL